MKRMKTMILLAALALVACGDFDKYQPKLSEQPKDKAKYDSDLSACKAEASTRLNSTSDECTAVWTAGGIIAATVHDTVEPENNCDWNKSLGEMTDECMASKGYKVVK